MLLTQFGGVPAMLVDQLLFAGHAVADPLLLGGLRLLGLRVALLFAELAHLFDFGGHCVLLRGRRTQFVGRVLGLRGHWLHCLGLLQAGGGRLLKGGLFLHLGLGGLGTLLLLHGRGVRVLLPLHLRLTKASGGLLPRCLQF